MSKKKKKKKSSRKKGLVEKLVLATAIVKHKGNP